MTDPITPDTVRKALEEGAPTCIKCGHKRGEHPYRHVFQPSHEVKITLADLARAYLDAMEENARMRKALEQLDASCTCREDWSGRKRQDPECPAGDYGDTARAGLGLPPRCQFNIRIAALRDLKGGEG